MPTGTPIGTGYGAVALDISGVRTAAAQAQASVGLIGRAFQGLNGTVQSTASQLTAQAGRLESQIGRVSSSLQLQQRALGLAQARQKELATAYGENSVAAQRQQLTLDRLTSSVQQQQVKLAGLQGQLANVRAELSSSGRAWAFLRENLQATGQQLTQTGAILSASITAPLTLVAAKAVSVAGDYQQSMAVLQATSGASEQQMEALRKKAVELGNDMTLPGVSAAGAGDAMIALKQRGLELQDAMDGAKGTLQLAAVGELEFADAAEISAGALNTFKLKGSEATRVADLLTAGYSASGASVREMGYSLAQAGTVFASANVPIDQTITLIGELAQRGLKGSDAGTALKTMMQKLQSPAKAAREELERLNISIYDQQGRMRPMVEIIGQFERATKNLSQQQRDAALNTIFGSDAIRAANIVISAGTAGFEKMRAAVNRQGAAAAIATAKMQGIKGAVEGLASTLETALLQSMQPVQDILERTIRAAADGVNAFMALDEGTRNAALAFVAVLAAAGPVLVGLGALASALAFVMTPVGALIIGLAALAALFVKNWDAIQRGTQVVATFVDSIGGMNQLIAIATGISAAYAAVTLSQVLPALLKEIQAQIARVAAIELGSAASLKSIAANAAMGASLLALAAATYGVVRAYQYYEDEVNKVTNKVLAGNTAWNKATDALEQYGKASEATQKKLKPQSDALKQLQDDQRAAIQRLAEHTAEYETFGFASEHTADSLQREKDAINARTAEIERATKELNRLTVAGEAEQAHKQAIEEKRAAYQRAAQAGVVMTNQVDQLTQQVQLSAEEIDDLTKQLAKVADEGPKALGAAISTEISFLNDREEKHREHTEKLADLQREYREATTDEARKAIQEKIGAEQASFAQSEQLAAEAYAREQAAQTAHLGQLLIQHVTAKARMAGVSETAIAEMTQKLATEYGVQQSLADRSFAQMTQSLDAWVANGGRNTDQYVQDLGRVREAATTTQQEVDRQISQMTARAKADFDAGKISADEYAERLRRIPGEAEKIAAALAAIPTRVESEVVIRYTREELDQALAEQRAGERNPNGPRPAPPSQQKPRTAGARALGGPVEAGKMYEVSEEGRPELLQVGGRQYLMMGRLPGLVVPAALGEAVGALGAAQPSAAAQAVATAVASPQRGMPGVTFSPQITIHNPVVDTVARLQQLADQIVARTLGEVEVALEAVVRAGV